MNGISHGDLAALAKNAYVYLDEFEEESLGVGVGNADSDTWQKIGA